MRPGVVALRRASGLGQALAEPTDSSVGGGRQADEQVEDMPQTEMVLVVDVAADGTHDLHEPQGVTAHWGISWQRVRPQRQSGLHAVIASQSSGFLEKIADRAYW